VTELVAATAEDMQALGRRIAEQLRPGDLVVLTGDLGAGKTTLTQGIARGLGVKDQVTSPTFTLVHAYDSGPAATTLLHADVYRLETLQEIIDLALPELIDEGAVLVVEWGEEAAPALLPDYLAIRIEFGHAEDERSVALRPAGWRWAARVGELRRALVGDDGGEGPA
jgi:tRNA threonylcarbamoyladenosine biosynthesis protein TsaE